MLDKNLSLYALSKLKLRNHDSFFKYLLLLSGDVNLNPGPIQNPCKKCLGSVNKKVIFCQNCNSWFHKKCELPNNPAKLNELKIRSTPFTSAKPALIM